MTPERTLEHKVLSTITWGTLVVRHPGGRETTYGQGAPRVCLLVRDECLFGRLLVGGRMALGETYAEGKWDVVEGRLSEFLGILLRSRLERRVRLGLKTKLGLILQRMALRPTSRSRARRCIASHYDLGNEFFRTFLDPSMTYSCGYRIDERDGLVRLQENKYALVCRKLGLPAPGRLLDVGCGWGGLLCYAGERHAELEGLGVTLSAQQREYAAERLSRAGLADRMRVEFRDYRELEGSFDFIASIGMFEHVGRPQYRRFMDRMRDLLAPGGVGVLHTMGVTGNAGTIDPWLEARIFPGADVPRLEEIVERMRLSELLVAHVENLAPHYADTLELWTENFLANEAEVLALDPRFDRRFLREWHYYLQLCEAGFRHGVMQLYQIVFAHQGEWPFEQRFDFTLRSDDRTAPTRREAQPKLRDA